MEQVAHRGGHPSRRSARRHGLRPPLAGQRSWRVRSPVPLGSRPASSIPTPGGADEAPTPAQLRYLRGLAAATGTTFSPPRTSAQASREIARLKALPADSRSRRNASCVPSRPISPPVYTTPSRSGPVRRPATALARAGRARPRHARRRALPAPVPPLGRRPAARSADPPRRMGVHCHRYARGRRIPSPIWARALAATASHGTLIRWLGAAGARSAALGRPLAINPSPHRVGRPS